MHPLQGRPRTVGEGIRLSEPIGAPIGGPAVDPIWGPGHRGRARTAKSGEAGEAGALSLAANTAVVMAAAAVLAASLTSGCVGPLALDGTSQSIGWHANGTLRRPAILPFKGDGYVIGEPWRARESNHGTDELVEAMVRASRAVARSTVGSVAALGDLSRAAGGGSAEHRSHQSGRDVDVFYYAVRPNGTPVAPGNAMIHFDRAGRSASWSPPQGLPAPSEPVPDVRFDARRNWRMVRALLTDPGIEVQWMFVARDLAARLVQEARDAGEDPALIARAAAILKQPSDSEPHDDHMHVRIFCDPADRQDGCIDKGPARWWKKHWKYMAPPYRRVSTGDPTAALLELMRTRVPLPGVGPKLTS